MSKPVFVTGNPNKASYLGRLLGISLEHKDINLDEIQSEDPKKIVEHKLRQAYELVKQPVLVEDTSMGIDAMHGLPGPFIKYFIEADKGAELICHMCDGFESRRATATVTFGYFDGQELEFFQNSIYGEISKQPGERVSGFGWDVVFIPDGYGGRLRSQLTDTEYDELYRKLKPIDAVREYIEAKA